MLKGLITNTSERVFLKSDPNTHFVAARVANKARPEAFQGYHADFLLFIIDEASGIPDEVFEVATSALSTPGTLTIMAGNPTRPSGHFFDTFHRASEGWMLLPARRATTADRDDLGGLLAAHLCGDGRGSAL